MNLQLCTSSILKYWILLFLIDVLMMSFYSSSDCQFASEFYVSAKDPSSFFNLSLLFLQRMSLFSSTLL